MSVTPVQRRLVASVKAAEEFRELVRRDSIDPKARKYVDDNVESLKQLLNDFMEGKL